MTQAILDQFVEAFNARDAKSVAGMFHDEATAQVIGAEFPLEVGRETICSTSIPYLFESDLSASVVELDDEEYKRRFVILFRTKHGLGPIDMLGRTSCDSTSITRLEYITGPHKPDELKAVGLALGIPTTE